MRITPPLACNMALLLSTLSHASDFIRLDQALPLSTDASSIAPVFDFDTDSCLPSAGISRNGEQNGGLKPSGSLTGGCRSSNFLDLSNTLHRYACTVSNNNTFCGHFYALYFEKDQILDGINSGHRHDWEYAAVWTTNGVVTHGSYSAHGNLTSASITNLQQQNGHLKIVYHKDGLLTHALRFAQTNEFAENPYGGFVTPTLTSWSTVHGDGVSNDNMRSKLNNFDYGSATIPLKDSNFLTNLNNFKPSSYPVFTQSDIENSK